MGKRGNQNPDKKTQSPANNKATDQVSIQPPIEGSGDAGSADNSIQDAASHRFIAGGHQTDAVGPMVHDQAPADGAVISRAEYPGIHDAAHQRSYGVWENDPEDVQNETRLLSRQERPGKFDAANAMSFHASQAFADALSACNPARYFISISVSGWGSKSYQETTLSAVEKITPEQLDAIDQYVRDRFAGPLREWADKELSPTFDLEKLNITINTINRL